MRVEIIDISDVSGSMDKLRDDIIGGLNAMISDQKTVDGEARLTQIQFNTNYLIREIGTNIQDVRPLTRLDYIPAGGTALLDAIGRTLNEQGKRINLEKWADKVIVCIRTDGEENSSREYSASRIKEMIEHAQAHGWEFIFAAANQDAFTTGAQYGIKPVYTTNFQATGAGVHESYAMSSATLRNIRAG